MPPLPAGSSPYALLSRALACHPPPLGRPCSGWVVVEIRRLTYALVCPNGRVCCLRGLFELRLIEFCVFFLLISYLDSYQMWVILLCDSFRFLLLASPSS